MAKSAGAIKLDEILESLQKNKQDVPESLKNALEEQTKVKAKTPTRKSRQPIPEGGPVSNEHLTQPNETPIDMGPVPAKSNQQSNERSKTSLKKKKSSKIARIVLKSLLGKSIANSILKPVKNESVVESKKESGYRSDIKKIKQDVEEIKAHLQLQTRIASKPLSKTRRVAGSFKKILGSFSGGHNVGAPSGPVNVIKTRLGINKPTMPHLTPTKPKLPDLIPDLPGMNRIPRHHVSEAMDAARNQIQEDRKNEKNAQQKVAMKATTNGDDQQLVTKKNEDVAREEANKKLDEHLDKIDKDIKKQHSGLKALIPLIVAGLWALVKPFWHIIKGGILFIRGAIKIIKPIIQTIKHILHDVWKGLKWLKDKITGIFGKLFGKETTKEGTKLGEKGLEKAGTKGLAKIAEKGGAKLLEKEGTKVAEKTIAKSLVKKIPIVGAIAGLGFAAYDIAKDHDLTEAGLDAASGIASIVPGIGTAASIGLDAINAARSIKKGMTADKLADNAPSTDRSGLIKRSSPTLLPDSKSAGEDLEDATNESSDDIDDETQPTQPIIVNAPVINAPRAKVTAQTPSIITVVNPRNPESSISRLTSVLFDDPSGWASTSRL